MTARYRRLIEGIIISIIQFIIRSGQVGIMLDSGIVFIQIIKVEACGPKIQGLKDFPALP